MYSHYPHRKIHIITDCTHPLQQRRKMSVQTLSLHKNNVQSSAVSMSNLDWLLLMTNSKSILAFNWCQNQRPWMTLKDHYAVFQNTCFFRSPSRKFEWKETHTISDEDVAQWLVSGNIGFVRIFAGVPWRGSVKRQWGNRKHPLCFTSATMGAA